MNEVPEHPARREELLKLEELMQPEWNDLRDQNDQLRAAMLLLLDLLRRGIV